MTLIGVEEVREVARRVIAERPNQVNPRAKWVREDGTEALGHCLYTSEEDPAVHCIAGQIAVELVGSAPGPDVEGAVNSGHDTEAAMWFAEFFDDEALGLLDRLQTQADRDVTNGNGRTWSTLEVVLDG